MKRWVAVFLIFFTSFSIQGQKNLTETEKLYSLCKVWGYLKYYHPVIAKGKIDWDNQLVKKIPQVEDISTKEELSKFYEEWINSLGEIKGCNECGPFKNEESDYNFDLSWIKDNYYYSKELQYKLNFIEKNRYGKKHHYFSTISRVGNVVFEDHRTDETEMFPEYEFRLLDIFNFWNEVEYFFPYKYVMDSDWDSVLFDAIPKIRYPKDTMDYHMAFLNILQAMDDGHVSNPSRIIWNEFGKGYYGFRVNLFESRAIVSGFYNPEYSHNQNIRLGDEILSINGTQVSQLIDERKRYTMGSNPSTHSRYLANIILKTHTDSSLFSIKRGNKTFERYILPILQPKVEYDAPDSLKWRIMEGNIGYVNLNEVKIKDVDRMMTSLMETKAIVFDNRGYPNFTMYKIAEYLNNERKDFAKFTIPDEFYPGKFVWAPNKSACGKNNGTKYLGKVIILVNEITQSRAEFTCMCLQTHANSITIGSQTAGADGNVSKLYLLGNRVTYMSGIGVYYPNGTPTQRIGVKIDMEVRPTLEGLVNGRDEVLEKAVEIAKINEK